MHGISYPLGLDVLDVCPPHASFAEGMVFTIELGIYIREEALGVRLENDFVIGKDKNIDLMGKIPIEAEEIEALKRVRTFLFRNHPRPAQNFSKAFTSSSLATPATMCPARLRARNSFSGSRLSLRIRIRAMAAKVFPLKFVNGASRWHLRHTSTTSESPISRSLESSQSSFAIRCPSLVGPWWAVF